jgi:hypothetical protein
VRIKGTQQGKLERALLNVFEDREAVVRFIRNNLGEQPNLILKSQNFQHSIFELLEWGNREYRIDEVASAALAINPADEELRKVVEELGLAAQAPLSDDDIEKAVIKTAYLGDTAAWRERMSLSELAVCRIQIGVGLETGYGTGFLLASNIVMTNHHVVKRVLQGTTSSDEVVLLFDYKVGPDGKTLNPGVEYKLAEHWQIASSPNSPNSRQPTTEELDYALLRVRGTPGDDPVGNQDGAPPRRWLTPHIHNFTKSETILIIQHPQLVKRQPTEPLKFAIGSLIDPDPFGNATRVTYLTSTEQGSSGSPCFNDAWQLVALHHSGTSERNEGVPFASILQDLEKKGVRNLI